MSILILIKTQCDTAHCCEEWLLAWQWNFILNSSVTSNLMVRSQANSSQKISSSQIFVWCWRFLENATQNYVSIQVHSLQATSLTYESKWESWAQEHEWKQHLWMLQRKQGNLSWHKSSCTNNWGRLASKAVWMDWSSICCNTRSKQSRLAQSSQSSKWYNWQ